MDWDPRARHGGRAGGPFRRTGCRTGVHLSERHVKWGMSCPSGTKGLNQLHCQDVLASHLGSDVTTSLTLGQITFVPGQAKAGAAAAVFGRASESMLMTLSDVGPEDTSNAANAAKTLGWALGKLARRPTQTETDLSCSRSSATKMPTQAAHGATAGDVGGSWNQCWTSALHAEATTIAASWRHGLVLPKGSHHLSVRPGVHTHFHTQSNQTIHRRNKKSRLDDSTHT